MMHNAIKAMIKAVPTSGWLDDQGANEERDDRRRGDSGSQVVNIALLFGVDGRKIQDDGQLDKLPRLDAVIRNPEPALGIPGHMSDNKQPEQSDDGNGLTKTFGIFDWQKPYTEKAPRIKI